MRIVLPEPFELARGLALRVHPAEPLATDLERWRARVLGEALVVELERVEADAGWPLTLVRTRDPAAVHAFYELFDRGVVVSITACDDASLEAARDRVREHLLAADLDRTSREVVALAQLWE